MKRFLTVFLCVLLIAATVLPVTAFAAKNKKVLYILKVNTDGARVRREANSGSDDNIVTSLKKGAKVFYLGKKKSMYKIRTEYGVVGYTYSGFLNYYGATNVKDVYKAADSVKVYSKPKLSSSRSATLSANQHVIVYATSGKWAYIHTLNGKKGYVRFSSLKKP